MTRLFAFIFAAAISFPVLPAKSWDVTKIQKVLDKSAVSLNGTCSGTLIENDLVLTAEHCINDQFRVLKRKVYDDKGVEKEEKVRISVPGSVLKIHYKGNIEVGRTEVYYKVVDRDTNTDLALVRTMESVGTGVAIECGNPGLLDKVYAIGNPHGILYNTVTVGQISSLNRSYKDLQIDNPEDPTNNGEQGFTQHTAPIAPGSSGGGLFNDEGKLMGVNVRGTPMGSVYFAVPTSDIRAFLNKNSVKVCE